MESEDHDRGEESHDALVAKSKRWRMLFADSLASLKLVGGVFADRAVVGNRLHVEKSPVCLESDLA